MRFPSFDWDRANEFIVDVTHPNSMTFFGRWTLLILRKDIWYTRWNVGSGLALAVRRISSVYDEACRHRRNYAKVDGKLSYPAWFGRSCARGVVCFGRKNALMDFPCGTVKNGQRDSSERRGTHTWR